MSTLRESQYEPYLIAVNLTKRCNLNCAHCYMDAEQRKSITAGELSEQEVMDLLSVVGKRAPGTIIVLTGGEPLLHPNINQIVKAGVAENLRMVVGTNGVLLTETLATELKASGLDGMGISIDSIDPKSHDHFRGMPGAFAKTCAAVQICRKVGLHVQIHFTVTKWNRHELKAVVELAKELGASILNFFFLICVGRGEGTMDLSPSEYEKALVEIAGLQKSTTGILVQSRCTPHFKRILHQLDANSPYTRATGYDGGGCLAGSHYCRITPKGEVTPCPYMELSAGNIRDQDFWKLWDTSTLFQSMRNADLLEGRCGSCEYKNLCGGCRAKALVQGNLMDEDPSCEYVPTGKALIQIEKLGTNDKVEWTPEALVRLSRLPVFLRPVVKKKLEARALAEGVKVTAELMARHKNEREKELGLKFK